MAATATLLAAQAAQAVPRQCLGPGRHRPQRATQNMALEVASPDGQSGSGVASPPPGAHPVPSDSLAYDVTDMR
jgi:hypothetical protein